MDDNEYTLSDYADTMAMLAKSIATNGRLSEGFEPIYWHCLGQSLAFSGRSWVEWSEWRWKRNPGLERRPVSAKWLPS